MHMVISKDNGLIVPQTWQYQYDDVREALIAYLQEQILLSMPSVVSNFFENMFGDFVSDDIVDMDMQQQAGYTWKDKKSWIDLLHERCDELIEFGDEDHWPAAFEALWRVKIMLETMIELIPG